MSRIGFGGLLVLGLFLTPLAAPGTVRADSKEAVKRYKGTLHKDGKSVEVVFDLDNPEDAKRLLGHLRSSEIEHVTMDKPPDLLALQWELGLWSVVVFILLYVILKKVAWAPMLEGLQKREHNIRSAIEDANRARTEAQALKEQWNKEMAQAQERVRTIMEEARHEAQKAQEQMMAETRAQIQTERERMRREIQTAKDMALQELWSQTAQLATLISSKALKRQLNVDDHRRLVDEAVAELSKSGQEWQRQVVGGRG